MKQKKIAGIINKRFKKAGVLFRDIICTFEIESIHDFRTEIKKLRAFLRLLNVETNNEYRFKISKKMKTLYGYAGAIRNLQLQLVNMDAYTGSPQFTIVEPYIGYLQKMIAKWQEHVIEVVGPGLNFYGDEKKILKHLPGKLRRPSAKKFLQHKMDEMAIFAEDLPDDDALHSIRKLLKDIMYNRAFVKPYCQWLPPVFADEEKAKFFTELLGLFLDKSVSILLLETYCKDCEESGLFFEGEIRDLQEIERRWKKEKEELAQTIYSTPALSQVSLVSSPHLSGTPSA